MKTPHSRTIARCALAVSLCIPLAVSAQVEKLSETQKAAVLARLPALARALPKGALSEHLRHAQAATGKPEGRDAAILATRVAADFTNAPAAPFLYYAVPAMSDNQRLPDLYPFDGQPGAKVRITAAGGEYEPGAFLVYPLSDLGKTRFSLTPFRTKDGAAFPAENLDLTVVKVWYQNRNGWYSYFGDTGFKLCPELLLHDEDLIRVDEARQANYARVTGDDGKISEVWLNPPREMDVRFYDHFRTPGVFTPMRKGFSDAKTLQPVLLEEGKFRSFFLTAHVLPGTPAGTYEGAVRLADASGRPLGEIPVALTVLPFDLPKPKAYINPDRDYLTASYSYISYGLIKEVNGGDSAAVHRQLVAVLRDQVEHNQNVHWIRGDLAETSATVDAMKEAGMQTDVIIGGPSFGGGSAREKAARARILAKWWDRKVGHHNVYLGIGDEPGAEWLMRARPDFEAGQGAGFHFIIAGGDTVFYKAGYLYDWHNVAKDPTDASSTALWNQVGQAYVAWYACMHIGPENPAFNRRQYGLAAYLAGYSAACNYAHHFGSYNDNRLTYKPMVFAYGCYDGVLDTLQWEGFREGVDDVRYATLMTSLAREALKSDVLETRYAGGKALQYLATFQRERDDLNACRLEMARHILALRKALSK